MASYTTAATKKEKQEYEALAAAKPVEQASQHQAAYDAALDKLLNREKFTYDANNDPLFEQYEQRYTQQGKLAMQDTMGQAAAMTGGYGNSYAQMAGQQTYNQYMGALADKIPELYALAQQQHASETADIQNRLSLLGGLVDRDHQLYREKVSDWNADLSRQYTEYANAEVADLNDYNARLQQDSIAAQNEANRIAAAKANTMSIDDYMTMIGEVEAAAENGNQALEKTLDALGEAGFINESVWAALYKKYAKEEQKPNVRTVSPANALAWRAATGQGFN